MTIEHRNRPQLFHATVLAVVLLVVLAFTDALTTHGSLKAQVQTAQYSVVDMGAFNPLAMNAIGNVVGFDASYRPVFWSAPVLTDLFPVVGSAVLTGINNSGQIIGNNGSRYFIYSSTSVTDIGVSTWGYNNPGINNYGHVVGSNASRQPFLYRDGTAQTLALPGCDWGTAEGINDSDDVIGNVQGGNCGNQSGVVWANGTPQILPTLPDASAGQLSSMGLNAGGQIVGEAYNPNPTAMLWTPDGHGGYTFANLGIANGYESFAQGVNDLGVVVGEVDTAAGPYAYIWHSASGIQDLNTLVPSGTDTLGWAGKINNAGMIMAYSYSSGHGYLLTPVSSPSTVATAAGPTSIWLGLKNSDDVGTKFDLLAEMLKNGAVVGSGEVDGVPGGSSGFNNAVQRAIGMALGGATSFSTGDALSVRLSVRIAATGHRSGTARLWYNDAAANSRFDVVINGVTTTVYLTSGSTLSHTIGTGPKATADVFVDRAVVGNPFRSFGTWTITF